MCIRDSEKGFAWIGAYDITADELLAGTDTAKTESKTAQAQMLILELLADGKRTVSYTHLDVYKRQDQAGEKIPAGCGVRHRPLWNKEIGRAHV